MAQNKGVGPIAVGIVPSHLVRRLSAEQPAWQSGQLDAWLHGKTIEKRKEMKTGDGHSVPSLVQARSEPFAVGTALRIQPVTPEATTAHLKDNQTVFPYRSSLGGNVLWCYLHRASRNVWSRLKRQAAIDGGSAVGCDQDERAGFRFPSVG